MTAEEVKQRAIAAEKRKKHEYYIANRDTILPKMREYNKRTRAERTANERKCREAKPLKYAETQLRYWERKFEETGDKVARWRVNYYSKIVGKLRDQENG